MKKIPQLSGEDALEFMRLHMPPERLWNFIVKRPNGCWEWGRARSSNGYGQVAFYKDGVSYYSRAHRLSWALTNGPLPPRGHVLHSCDNPPCCNPAHLRVGTHQENIADAVERGRMARGEAAGTSKLTDEIVTAARVFARHGAVITLLAEAVGVSQSALANAVHGNTWSHLADPVPVREHAELTSAQLGREVGLGRERVRQLRERGNTDEEIRAGSYKRSPYGPRGKYAKVDWSSVDWSLPNSEIARIHGCASQTVTYQRKRRAVLRITTEAA